jgi:hypothetical protein
LIIIAHNISKMAISISATRQISVAQAAIRVNRAIG